MTGSGWASRNESEARDKHRDLGGRAAELMSFEHFLEGLKRR